MLLRNCEAHKHGTFISLAFIYLRVSVCHAVFNLD